MLLELYIEQIKALCRKYRVKTLSVFGSVLTPRFNQHSDVDLVVDFNDIDPADYADNYLSLKRELENLFQREVDLIEGNGIKNSIFRNNVNRTKQVIYG